MIIIGIPLDLAAHDVKIGVRRAVADTQLFHDQLVVPDGRAEG